MKKRVIWGITCEFTPIEWQEKQYYLLAKNRVKKDWKMTEETIRGNSLWIVKTSIDIEKYTNFEQVFNDFCLDCKDSYRMWFWKNK